MLIVIVPGMPSDRHLPIPGRNHWYPEQHQPWAGHRRYRNDNNERYQDAPYHRHHHDNGHHEHRSSRSSRERSECRFQDNHEAGTRNVPDQLINEKICFLCLDYLQNSPEANVHLCDGGTPLRLLEEESSTMLPCLSRFNKQLDELVEDGGSNRSMLDDALNDVKIAIRTHYEYISSEYKKYIGHRVSDVAEMQRQVQDRKEAITRQKGEILKKEAALEKKELKMTKLKESLEVEKKQMEEEIRMEKDELRRQWQELRDELSRMEQVQKVQKGRVRLDVGGHVFTTSSLTLCSQADSMLAAMFSGRHVLQKEDDGTIFIDRDGTHFRFILNYLRDGSVSSDTLPKNKHILRQIRNEAIYYQLHRLVQIIDKCM